jgi:RNA-binding protein
MSKLAASRRSELRAQAHALSPVVIIGDKGLTDQVVAEIDRSLKAHELIKVRAAAGDRAAREEWMRAICEKLEAHPVQGIGKVLVLFRENPKERVREVRKAPQLEKPEPRGKPTARKSRVARIASESKRTARPRSRIPSARPESEPRRRRPRSSR